MGKTPQERKTSLLSSPISSDDEIGWMFLCSSTGEEKERNSLMEKAKERLVLCGANSYVEKYYLNEQFSGLPESVKKELQMMCVMYTEDIGGVLMLEFTPEGNLEFRVEAEEADFLFDEIGSVLKIKQYQAEKRELLEALELYYKVRILGIPAEVLLDEEQMERYQEKNEDEA